MSIDVRREQIGSEPKDDDHANQRRPREPTTTMRTNDDRTQLTIDRDGPQSDPLGALRGEAAAATADMVARWRGATAATGVREGGQDFVDD